MGTWNDLPAQHQPRQPGREHLMNPRAPCRLFLACDGSPYMTGQVLHPDGGEIVGG